MNVLFLTMAPIPDINVRELYPDLLRFFVLKGHKVFLVSPRDRRLGIKTYSTEDDNVVYLGVRTLNLQKSIIIEKGVGLILVPWQFKRAILKYWRNARFDLILYATPPITLQGVVAFMKIRNPSAMCYLLLKDIFPQNAVDIGMMTKSGLKGFLYKYFRKKEKALYQLSDFIGCMSPANMEYILKHNPEIDKNKVEVAPNSVDISYSGDSGAKDNTIRYKYGIPVDKPLFIYGGNIGKPQGVDFIISCLDAVKNREDCFFLIVGNGTEYIKLESWVQSGQKKKSIMLLPRMERNDYDAMVRASDVGLVFLDCRFTIPNFPSRVLNYMENRLPVICATDVNSDIGMIAETNGFGFWCESKCPGDFVALVDKMLAADRETMGNMGYEYLSNNYLVEHTYKAIMRHV